MKNEADLNIKTIIAHLNDTQALSRSFIRSLNEGFIAKGISEPDLLSKPEDLLRKLEEYKANEIILFTNFPPDSSYPESGRSVKQHEKNGIIHRWTEADNYSRTYRLFNSFLKKYRFVAIHFITGAPEEMIQDSFLETALDDTPITVTRRIELFNSGSDYWTNYRNLILSKALIP